MTKRQRLALNAIRARPYITPGALAPVLDTSKEGAAQTASSLVRRGLVERHLDRDRRVHYRAIR